MGFSFCPFSSMMKFLHHHSPTPQSAPLFITDGCNPMTRFWFSSKLQFLFPSCGLSPERYSPHSLRICAATTVALLLPTWKHGEIDNANSVQQFGDCVGDKHSFCKLLAISYMVVTVTTHTNKLTLFRHTNHSETSCCSRRVCTY